MTDNSFRQNYGWQLENVEVNFNGEEIYRYILGIDKLLKTFKGECIVVINRINDVDIKKQCNCIFTY